MFKNEQFSKLRRLNLIAAAFHFISGLIMVIISTDLKVPITGSFLHFDPSTQSLAPKLDTLFDLHLGPLVASFLFMSALAHLIISLPGIYEKYIKGLENRINIYRWIEYSFSSSVMIIVVSLLVGISDLATLILAAFANVSMILFGWMMELHNQTTKKTNWTSYIFGCIAGIGPWVAIAIYLASPGSTSNPPTFVYWIFVSIFIFFNIFAINQVLQYKGIGKWKDYVYGEKAYIFLSFIAKSLLAWQVFAGTLRP